ncbi:putative aromatic acid decarboxylase [Poriferisphaera corsica]|uniref:Flavin prenyltransferase UbiX n=1 Tax=Poriferisphaera corsica TaxID=2528020 RepID=A0A517YW18_9BACT|nr:UbiX family flavin prenyltransferase [Poriferisphaera corsica]QDU34406.1 putative aromatic acid decarboxylase [Poriferisphaera corsica]
MPLISKNIVLGITGASGAPYAQRALHALLEAETNVHLVISSAGQRLLHDELQIVGNDISSCLPKPLNEYAGHLTLHNHRNIGASIASGSFKHDGMIIVPCTSGSLAAIATSQSNNLIQRAAYVTLKERRRLILLHRESPLTLADIRNMETLTLMGATIMPATPGFYTLPKTIDDLVNHVTARLLDQLDIPHQLAPTWDQQLKKNKASTHQEPQPQVFD